MNFEEVEAPQPLTQSERDKKRRGSDKRRASNTRYERTDKGRAHRKEARKRYRHSNSKHQTDAQYLAREFRAWDGEGVTLDDGSHIYTILAAKTRGKQSVDILDTMGLPTLTILQFVLDTVGDSDAINVVYGGSYDFNMWLSDLPAQLLDEVYREPSVMWHGFRIAWRRGKSFTVSRFDSFGNRIGKAATIYDCVSFFQTTFVRACDVYLGGEWEGRDVIVASKNRRGTFDLSEQNDVRAYNDLELDRLLDLMYELRARLNKVGLRPRRWDGPGAIAAALLQREGVKKHMAETPPEVARAARLAYAGGRFEVIKFGHSGQPVYEYDVNSAYPAAMLNLPSLVQGTWKGETGRAANKVYPFALYRVSYKGKRADIPGALFRRSAKGNIAYPWKVNGWYWTPEFQTLRKYCGRGWGEYTAEECWRFIPDAGAVRPFAFIEGLYNKRRALKAAGDGAHVGLKLGLNSLYGKLAQQVGARLDARTGTWRKPPFHQLEWAGYVTSWCRAKVLEAAMQDIESVIAFETDALFTSRPLSLPITSNLGDFEQVNFDDLTYVMSGMYWGNRDGKEIAAKTRGVLRGTMSRLDALTAMREPLAADREFTVTSTRFNTLGLALHRGNLDIWRRWETITKTISAEPTGKRVHSPRCCKISQNYGLEQGRWHLTICPFQQEPDSAEFPVLWVRMDEAMAMLGELRDEEVEYDYE